MKPLFIPLRTRWFRAFACGEKTIEYRVYGARWNERTCILDRPVILSHGYSGARLNATVIGMTIVERGIAPQEARDLFPCAERIAALHLRLGHAPRQV